VALKVARTLPVIVKLELLNAALQIAEDEEEEAAAAVDVAVEAAAVVVAVDDDELTHPDCSKIDLSLIYNKIYFQRV
jgi:hypothetical protein